jgi:hypothetical protein
VAKGYGVHPNTVNAWKKTFLEKRPEIFAQDNLVADYERQITEQERLIDLLPQQLTRGEAPSKSA